MRFMAPYSNLFAMTNLEARNFFDGDKPPAYRQNPVWRKLRRRGYEADKIFLFG